MAASLHTIIVREPLSPTSLKRKRAGSDVQPLTPPLSATDPEGTRLLSRAVNVLSTAATALSQVTILYQSDPVAQEGLLKAVEVVTNVNQAGGKLIICGVGKSGLVGRKIVATMKSLGIASSFMHAAEALHGDLGDIRKVCFAARAIPNVIMYTDWSRTTPSCSYRTPARLPNSWLSSTTYPHTRRFSLYHRTQNHQTVRCWTNGRMLFCYLRQYMSWKRLRSACVHLQRAQP